MYNDRLDSKIIWRIALYIRLSVADGNDESLSVSNQRKLLIDFLEKEFSDLYTVIDLYVDDGLTGTDDERTNFQRMIRDIDSGKVNCVICKNLSRIFRNYADQGYFLEEFFPLRGIRFITLGDPKIDTLEDPEKVNGLEVPITGILNDRYAQKTSMDIRRTFKNMAESGEFLGGFPPYGYIRNPEDKHKFLVDKEAAEVVREIYRLYVYEGYSKHGIVLSLNDLGIPNPSTYKKQKGLKYRNPRNDKSGSGYWSTVTIDRILKNKTYLGSMVQLRTKVISYKVHKQVAVPQENWSTVENTHEAIIDFTTYEMAQKLLKSRGRTPEKARTVHIFSGLIRCADCKRILQRKRAGPHIYFTCKTYYDHSKTACCSNHSIREDVLSKAVLQAIQAQVSRIENMDKMVAKIQKQALKNKYSDKLSSILEDSQKAIEKNNHILDEAYMDWKQDHISKEQYLRIKEQIQSKQAHHMKIIANVQEEMEKAEAGTRPEHEVIDYFLKHKNVKNLSRALLVELIEVIYVHEDKSITIQFNYADRISRVLNIIQDQGILS